MGNDVKTEQTICENGGTSRISSERTRLIEPCVESLDDALAYVGNFGKYQYFLLLAMLPFTLAYTSLYFSQIFFTLTPTEHWCKVTELINSNLSLNERLEASIPRSNRYPFYDTCRYKNLDYRKLLNQGRDFHSPLWQTNQTKECEKWEYNLTQIPYASLAAELDWVCDESHLILSSQTIFFGGSLVGGLIFGRIADYNGRIPAITLLCIVGFVASCFTAAANSFWSFAVCRFLSGMAFDHVINIPIIIVFEYIAPEKRSLVVNFVFGTFFALGSTLLPWLAYTISNWRILCIVTTLPLFIGISTPYFLPESIRWHFSNNQKDKVLQKLYRIALVNGKHPNQKFYQNFYEKLNYTEDKVEKSNLYDLFTTPRLGKNAMILLMSSLLSLIAFDGHVYSLKLLKNSVFLSFGLAALTELPASLCLLLVLDRWGRVFCVFITMACVTFFTIAEILLISETMKLIMAVLSRFCLNMATNVVIQYATEFFPTCVRGQGVAMSHIFGIFGHALAPYVVESAKYWHDLPLVIIAVISAVCTVLFLMLPETSGKRMPETLADGENFGKGEGIYDLPVFKPDNRTLVDNFLE